MGAVLLLMLLTTQSGGRTDVGDLEALAAIQTQLRAVDACRIEYNLPRKKRYRRTVFVTACDQPTFASSGRIDLPEKWAHDALSVEAVRSSTKDDWSILVDQKEVPFPVLVEGLGELAPIVVREAPRALAQARTEEERGRTENEENRRRLQQQQESNQNSYPPRWTSFLARWNCRPPCAPPSSHASFYGAWRMR